MKHWDGLDALSYGAAAAVHYLGPDGFAVHPGDRIGIEPPGCVKERNIQRLDMPQEVADWLDRFVPWAQREIAKAGNVPEKLLWGEVEPPRCDAGNIWRWPGFDALELKNPEIQILGKDGGKMLNVKGIDEKKLLAALHNAARKDTEESVGAVYDMDVTPERAGVILYGLNGGNPEKRVYIKKMHGRYIYMEFWRGMTQIDCTRYDAHNGQGKAAEVVAALRKEIADKKNAERKAERAKRHRLAAYWMDGESHAQFVCSGGNAGEYVRVGAQLLASVIRELPEKMRGDAVSDAMTIVLQEIKERGENDD